MHFARCRCGRHWCWFASIIWPRRTCICANAAEFGVSVLKAEQDALSEYFADPERNPDSAHRLGIRYRKMKSGRPVLENALANLDCRDC